MFRINASGLRQALHPSTTVTNTSESETAWSEGLKGFNSHLFLSNFQPPAIYIIMHEARQNLGPERTRLRSACDFCHQSKVRCSGGNPCSGCYKLRLRCNYSDSKRTGRPRGVKNKRTLQRLQGLEAAKSDHEAPAATVEVASSHSASISSSNSSCDVLATRASGLTDYLDFTGDQIDSLLVFDHLVYGCGIFRVSNMAIDGMSRYNPSRPGRWLQHFGEITHTRDLAILFVFRDVNAGYSKPVARCIRLL